MIEFADQVEGRYDRQTLISWWDQPALANARIIVAGAGALGNEVLKLLALMGVGHVLVIDFDTVSRSNLSRTILFREEDVGKPKAHIAKERLHEINPEVDVRSVDGDLRTAVGLGELRAADVVLGCLDSVNARWALNRRCLQAGVEWIDGAISDFHGSVARYSPDRGACYECTFTPRTLERFHRRYSCPFGLVSSQAQDKTPTTAVTSSVIAAIQVQQALMMLHHVEEGLRPGERLTVYLKPYRMLTDRLPVNPDCLAHDTLPADIPVTAYDGALTAGEAIEVARTFLPTVDSLCLPLELVVEFRCDTCGAAQPVLRYREHVLQDEAMCPACGELRTPTCVEAIGRGSALAALSLGQLGIPRREILSFSHDDGRFYLQFGE